MKAREREVAGEIGRGGGREGKKLYTFGIRRTKPGSVKDINIF
jgi:hypothetical protein